MKTALVVCRGDKIKLGKGIGVDSQYAVSSSKKPKDGTPSHGRMTGIAESSLIRRASVLTMTEASSVGEEERSANR